MDKIIVDKILSQRNPEKAKLLSRYFKTGKGQYAEGDIFLGLTNPEVRTIPKAYAKLTTLRDVEKLLQSEFHEVRLCGLLILVEKYRKSDESGKREIFDFYLSNTKGINNWDLVDVTCHKVVGEYLLHHPKEREILYTLAKSNNMWERRISIISTFAFIRQGQLSDSIDISSILLHDKEDLIHKAVGWALREVYKKNKDVTKKFIEENISTMPRVMLRYAIEKMPEDERKGYLNK